MFMFLIVFNIICYLLFLVFAFLSLYDKDPWFWALIYLSAGACCALSGVGKFYPMIYLLFIVFSLFNAVILFFAIDGIFDWIKTRKMHRTSKPIQSAIPNTEKARKFFGLLIIIGALLINYICVR